MNSETNGTALTKEQLSEVKKSVPITTPIEVNNNNLLTPLIQ